MLNRILMSTLAVMTLALSTPVLHAEPKDDLLAAVKKVADSPNYSWTSTVEGGFGAGATNGKTEKDGYTALSLTLQNTSYDVYLKDKKAVIKAVDGWKTADEITAAAPPAGGGGRGGFTPERMVAQQAAIFQTPIAQATDAADKLSNVKKSADGFTADLTEAAAKEMMAFRGRGGRGGRGAATTAPAPAPDIKDAKATLQIWIKEGALSKIAIHVSGSMNFNGNDFPIDRTTTTEIKDVGTTKVTVPDDAKKKLLAPTAVPAAATKPA